MKINKDLLRMVDELYREELPYLDMPNPRVMILLSGPPSSGKTTLARQIEAHYQGIRLQNDAIRVIASKLEPDAPIAWKSELAATYMDYARDSLLSRSPNGFWIIDANIESFYDKHAAFATANGFAKFLIALSVPLAVRRTRAARITDRLFTTQDRYLHTMEAQEGQQERFLAKHAPDLLLGAQYDVAEVYAAIDDVIRCRLDSL